MPNTTSTEEGNLASAYGLSSFTGEMGFVSQRETTFSFDNEKKREKTNYSWKELNYLEERRRAILKRVEMPIWRILLFWDGTCLKALSRDWLIWLTLAIYIGIRAMAWTDIVPHFVDHLANTDIAVLGGFLSFFLVLFVNQTNIRFNAMYMDSMMCEKFVLEVASVTATMFPRPNALRIVRYLNAAHAAAYTGLSRTYTKAAFFDELNKRLQFLSPKELERIENLHMDHGDDCARELLTWCMMEIQNAQKKDFVDGRAASLLREKVLGFQAKMNTLYAYNDQPVHFYYIHFLCLLSALYLPLFALTNAYSAGFGEDMNATTDAIQGILVLVQAIYVIGLRLLGQQMADPYGDDLEDLSVLYYVWSTAAASRAIFATEYPEEIVPALEEQLALAQVTMGAPKSAQDREREDSSTGVV